MYQVAMYHTVKTLLSQGRSQREIARDLSLCRKTVGRIKKALDEGLDRPAPQVRSKRLDSYAELIVRYHEEGLTALLIHQRLKREQGLQVSYPSVARWIEALKQKEVYTPIHSPAGQEAQVDFGYLGKFLSHGKWVKAWIFCMVLSYSRYAYYQVVSNQKLATFITCHQRGFEYFGGAVRIVKLDNLKAGVVTPDFYQPHIQEQYAAFLSHYGCAPVPCKVRTPQHKGKVESGIKYVKNNFLKDLRSREWEQLVCALKVWNEEVCNRRVHGTTRRIPAEVFLQSEKPLLRMLPAERYPIMEITYRKVSQLAHVSYQYNYYSVPYQYAGKQLRLESNATLLRIYDERCCVATHGLCNDMGCFITQETHKPAEKQQISREEYHRRMTRIGPDAVSLMEQLQQRVPSHWISMTRGILHLQRSYSHETINRACRRALRYGAVSYQQVKKICESGLYRLEEASQTGSGFTHGYGHELSMYDQL